MPAVKGMRVSPNSLANLKKITPETHEQMVRNSHKSRMLNREIREKFKLNAKAFLAIKQELPTISALDVIRMAMHMAIEQDNFEDAARYAVQIAEYEAPKLQRIDQTTTSRTEDLSDDELRAIVLRENLGITSS